ncbi:hypothetical protein ZTR_00871 [Talaromyces verruculosus]|nr:hypothetical protein ZTR_00871 [Talaromyces verruculosus]
MPVSLTHQLRSDPTNKHEFENFLKVFFPADEIIMDPESRRIGNREGHNLIELLQDLHKQVEEQRKYFDEELKEAQNKIEEQRKHFAEELKETQNKFEEQQKRIGENDYLLLAAYANELEWTAGKSDAESRYTRNDLIHGGDIRYATRSIELLEELGEATRVQNASEGFEITYGVSIGKIRPIIATAPEEIADLLNKRAVLQKLWKWEEVYPEGRRKWIKDCDQAIKTWLLTGGDSYLKEYSRLSQWIAEHVDIIKATAS